MLVALCLSAVALHCSDLGCWLWVGGSAPPFPLRLWCCSLFRTPPRFASVLAVSGFVLALISRDLRLSLVLVVWFPLFLFFSPRRYLRFFFSRETVGILRKFPIGIQGLREQSMFRWRIRLSQGLPNLVTHPNFVSHPCLPEAFHFR